MLITKDRLGAFVFLVFSIAYGFTVRDIPLFPGDEFEPFNARTMPTLLAYFGAAVSFLILIRAPEPGEGSFAAPFLGLNWGVVFKLAGLMIAYGFGLYWLGFLIATTAFLMAGFWVLGERRRKIILSASLPIVVAFWLILTKFLSIYLTPGELYLDFMGG